MASTNKTVNYELSQFIETDKPGWLTDYNSDMRKLDAGLKSVSDVASGASADLSDLTDRVSTAESAITTNTNNITSLDARTDTLEAQAQSSAAAITNLQTEQTTQNLGIEAATKLGYNIARPYDAASTYAVGDYVLFQNTLYKCVTAIPVGEEFVPAKWLAIKVMDEIGSDEGFEITPLDASNFPLNPTLLQFRHQNFDAQSSDVPALSNPTVSFYTDSGRLANYYAKYKNIRILELHIKASFDAISFTKPSAVSFTMQGFSTPSFIDHPRSMALSSAHGGSLIYKSQTESTLSTTGALSMIFYRWYFNPNAAGMLEVDMDNKFIYLVNE